jgi:hypothetical protein
MAPSSPALVVGAPVRNDRVAVEAIESDGTVAEAPRTTRLAHQVGDAGSAGPQVPGQGGGSSPTGRSQAGRAMVQEHVTDQPALKPGDQQDPASVLLPFARP